MSEPTCSEDGCSRAAKKRGRCEPHYRAELLKTAPRCSVDACTRSAEKRGLCAACYKRWRMYGDPTFRAACVECGATVPGDGTRFKFCGKRQCQRRKYEIYYAANRDRVSEAGARYYAAHFEQVGAAVKRWRQANPEKVREMNRRCKARPDRPCSWIGCEQFAAVGKPFCRQHHNEDQRRRHARQQAARACRLYEIQHGVCPDSSHGGCGQPLWQPAGNHIDHLIPLARNGPDEDWNLQLMHRDCNLGKSTKLVPAALELAWLRNVAVLTGRTSGHRSSVA